MVRNDGHDVARKCRGRLMAVLQRDADGRTAPAPGFVAPVVLKWAHELDWNWNPRDIEHDAPRRLDLCYALQSAPLQLRFFRATRRRPGCRQYSRPGYTRSVSEWMPRTPLTSRAPSTSTSPMGGAKSRSRWPERSRSGACCPGLTRHPADEHRPSTVTKPCVCPSSITTSCFGLPQPLTSRRAAASN